MKDVLSNIPKSVNLKDNKYLPIFLIGGVIVIVCLIVIVYFSFFYGGSSSYSDIRSIMRSAAVDYCDENCDGLFEGVNSVTVPATTLISNGYMDDFSELTGDKDNSCSGDVVISKSYDGYSYISKLDCGSKYSEESIYDVVLRNNEIVESGSGLYDLNGGKVFRGEYVDNYLKLGETMFRIVKINSDNSLLLVLNDYDKSTMSVWDDRYNSAVEKNDGINDYSISRAKETLDDLISNVYRDDIINKAIGYDYCIGSRDSSSVVNDGSLECSIKYNDYISLLTVYDIINASVDGNCKSIDTSINCQNYNYLTEYDSSIWTITPVSGTTEQVYYYDGSDIDDSKARVRYSLRFVITISGDEVYESGDGTLENPYILYE